MNLFKVLIRSFFIETSTSTSTFKVVKNQWIDFFPFSLDQIFSIDKWFLKLSSHKRTFCTAQRFQIDCGIFSIRKWDTQKKNCMKKWIVLVVVAVVVWAPFSTVLLFISIFFSVLLFFCFQQSRKVNSSFFYFLISRSASSEPCRKTGQCSKNRWKIIFEWKFNPLASVTSSKDELWVNLLQRKFCKKHSPWIRTTVRVPHWERSRSCATVSSSSLFARTIEQISFFRTEVSSNKAR